MTCRKSLNLRPLLKRSLVWRTVPAEDKTHAKILPNVYRSNLHPLLSTIYTSLNLEFSSTHKKIDTCCETSLYSVVLGTRWRCRSAREIYTPTCPTDIQTWRLITTNAGYTSSTNTRTTHNRQQHLQRTQKYNSIVVPFAKHPSIFHPSYQQEYQHPQAIHKQQNQRIPISHHIHIPTPTLILTLINSTIYLGPLVYPSHNFAKKPPCSRCSFQLARRPAILGSRLSLFCECRLANSPRSPEALLERRRSLTVGGEVGEPDPSFVPVEALVLLEEVVEVSEPWVSQ